MKLNHRYLICLVLLSTLVFTACSTKNDPTPEKPTEVDLLSAKEWSVNKVVDQTDNTDVTTSFSNKKMKFNKDNTYTHNLGSTTETGTYTFGGGIIMFSPTTGTAYTNSLINVSVKSSELTFKTRISQGKTGTVAYVFTMK